MTRHRSLLAVCFTGLVLTAALATAVFAQKTELEVKPAASEAKDPAATDEDTTDGKMHPPAQPLTPWISGVFLNPFLMPDFFGGLTFDWHKLVLSAELPKKSDTVFWFTRNRVVYFKTNGEQPASVEVDQKPWPDLKKPFELDFVPDFATAPDAKSVFVDGDVTMTLSPMRSSVILQVKNDRDTAIPLKFRMSMRTDKALTHQLKQTGMVLDATEDDFMPISSRPSEGNAVEAQKKKPAKPDDIADLVIEGDVDRSAVFLMKGNTLVYKDGARKGKYPSKVTVNETPWKNLEQMFVLDFVPDLDAASAYAWFQLGDGDRAFSLATATKGRLALTVTNSGDSAAHVRHTIRLPEKADAKPHRPTEDELEIMMMPYSIDAEEPFLAEEPIIIQAGNGKKAQDSKAQQGRDKAR